MSRDAPQKLLVNSAAFAKSHEAPATSDSGRLVSCESADQRGFTDLGRCYSAGPK